MNLLRRLLPGIALVTGTFLLSVGLQALAAWSAPSGAPPSSNAYAPLNTGPTAQTKGGNLTVGGQITITGGTPGVGKVLTSNASGLATWTTPSGITSLSQGTGMSFSANPITTTGTISLASQSCPGGQFVTAIGGTIACATPSGNSGTVTSVGTNNGLTGGTITTSGTLGLNLTGISACTNATTNKIYWNGSYLACGTDQTGVGSLSGSGTANYVSKWTGPTSLGNSLVYDDGSNVGIGTASPSEKLHVNGSVYVGSNWYKAGNLSSVNNAIGVWSAEGGVVSGFNSGRAVGMGQTTSGYAGMGISSGATSLSAFYYDPFSNGTSIESYGARNINLITNGVNRMIVNSGGDIQISGRIGANGYSPNSGYPPGWWGGIHAFDIYSEGTVGAGSGGALRAFINQAGEATFASGNATINSGGYIYNNSTINTQDVWLRNANTWATSYSDMRLKKDIAPLTNVLDRLQNIQGVSFNWNDAYAALGHSNDKRQIGVIAQELETQFPELVTASSADGYKTVNYEGLTAVLVEAVKEQQKEIDSLKARLDALEKK